MSGHLRVIWKPSGAYLCHLRATFNINRPSWTHLGPYSTPFEPIWAHVRSHLGSSWAPFGAILGPMLGHLLRSLQPSTTPQMLKEGAAVHRRRRLRLAVILLALRAESDTAPAQRPPPDSARRAGAKARPNGDILPAQWKAMPI